ncbi:hypothetical protein D3C73_1144340 [compost metagenome]
MSAHRSHVPEVLRQALTVLEQGRVQALHAFHFNRAVHVLQVPGLTVEVEALSVADVLDQSLAVQVRTRQQKVHIQEVFGNTLEVKTKTFVHVQVLIRLVSIGLSLRHQSCHSGGQTCCQTLLTDAYRRPPALSSAIAGSLPRFGSFAPGAAKPVQVAGHSWRQAPEM